MGSKGFEEVTNGIKNVLQMLFLGLVLVALFSQHIQMWMGSKVALLARSGVESIKIGELELKLRQAEQAIKTLANNPQVTPPTTAPKQEGPKDQTPPPSLSPALQLINEPGSFWVYVGQFQNGRFIRSPNFNVTQIPKADDELAATADTYKRDALPVPQGQDWRLGQIVGVVKEGQHVKVRRVEVIEGGNVWAQAVIPKQ